MATINADNFAKQANPTSDNILDPGVLGGRKRVQVDQVTLAAAAINDVIRFGKALPRLATVTGIRIATDGLGAGVTLDVGDVADPDRYKANLDVSAAGQDDAIIFAGQNYKVTGTNDDVIQATIEGAAATGTVKIVIEYTTD